MTELVVGNGQRTAAINEWDESYKQLVVQMLLRPKNRPVEPAELALFAEQCVRTGLDPMAKQIYGIFRHNKMTAREEMTIQVGIDGLRALAERTGRYAGSAAYEFCGPDKVWTDVWLESQKPVAAKALVRKVIGGTVIETEAVALWSEYGATKNVWASKPAHMLGKCAEALALRKAFPADMSGLYTDDEMARADTPVAVAPVAVPEIAEAVALVTDEQVETIVAKVAALADMGVKSGVLLVSHGATVDRESFENTVRSLPAEAFASLVAELDELLAEDGDAK